MNSVVHISEAANLAIHTMVLLASAPERSFSVREAARVLEVSENHLAKVLQRLGRVKLVTSTRGPQGGFCLARASEKISLLEIYEAIEGPIESPKCLFSRPRCQGPCILGDFVSRTNAEFVKHLQNARLSQVASVMKGE